MYHEEVMQTPTTPEDWMVIANHNSQRWQYHHCLGTIDGKHVAIRKPMNGGLYYYDYKNFHLIILMALVDDNYKFTWIEVGANGPSSDAQIFEDCGLKQAIEKHVIGFPPPDHLPDDDRDTPYFFVGDDAIELAIAEESARTLLVSWPTDMPVCRVSSSSSQRKLLILSSLPSAVKISCT